MRTHSDGNHELKPQIVPDLGAVSLIAMMLICLPFSVWIPMSSVFKWQFCPRACPMKVSLLPALLWEVYFLCMQELCKQTENPGKAVAVPLVWATPREQNTWLLMRQILSHCAFSKPPVLCYPSVRLRALLSLCRVFNFDGFAVIPAHSSSSSCGGSENTWEAFAVLMASGSPKTLHVTFPFLACALLNAPGVTSG